MPISSRGFTRRSFALLLVGLAALVAIVATTIWLAERNQVYLDEVAQARTLRRDAVELRHVLSQAQTGQRGYLIARDDDYLDPYAQAVTRIGPALDALGAALEAFPEAAPAYDALRLDIATKLAELALTIELAQAGDLPGAIAIVRTDEGEAAMLRIVDTLNSFIAMGDERTVESASNQRNAVANLRWVAIIGAIIILGVFAGAIYLVRRYTDEIDRARSELTLLNTDLEGRVAERTEDLIRANEEVQRFAYIVTHDLRAPLVNIMGFTSELDQSLPPIQALIEKADPGESDPVLAEARRAALEDLPESIAFIRSSTRKMDGLINAILKISREGRRDLRPEEVDLGALIGTTVNALQHQIAAADGEVAIETTVPTIVTDRMTLDQILGNLLDNAVKYRAADRPLRIAITATRDHFGTIRIAVRDNGRGIASEDHERVFELFRRSGVQDQAGEGIGLAHVRIMARNLGGDITLQSQAGEGATFTVTLAPDLRAIRRRTQ